VFGYYVGPATRITATVDGRRIQAGQARWSQESQIVIFWFDPADVPDGTAPTNLAAYNAAGSRLPAGDTKIYSG
jgi:hypothetical protein